MQNRLDQAKKKKKNLKIRSGMQDIGRSGEGNNNDGEASIAEPPQLDESRFKVYVVHKILSKETEKAVELVCQRNHVKAPSLRIGGVPKGHKRALGVYSVASNSVAFRDQDQFFNPFVVLHELYHCIRSKTGTHKGTEKKADRFAMSFIEEYNKFVNSISQTLSTHPIDVD